MKYFLLLFLLVIVLVDSHAQSPDKVGSKIFKNICKACHTIGHGDLVGPDLINIHQRVDSIWLIQFIHSPIKLYEQKDSIVTSLYKRYGPIRMPETGLSDSEIIHVINYIKLKSQRSKS